MIAALLILIIFAILFPKVLRFLFALLFISGIAGVSELSKPPPQPDRQQMMELWQCLVWQERTHGLDRQGSSKAEITRTYGDYARICRDRLGPP